MSTIRHIRTAIFGVRQDEFARIANVNQATVSKWEKGTLSPDYNNLLAIRTEASARGIEWNDEWFFEEPGADLVPKTEEGAVAA